MLLKLGSKGKEVEFIQYSLGLKVDGDFGKITEDAVIAFQKSKNIKADGVVGDTTWGILKGATTDSQEKTYTTSNGLIINKYYLPKGEYLEGPTKKEYCFLHHTAGWNNPYNQVDSWGRDTRGKVGTEFILGGNSITGDTKYDGIMLQAIPKGGYGWHLGENGSQFMHEHSVAIELCNFGWVKDGKTYTGAKVDPKQIVTLDQEFRGYKSWHLYSPSQLESLKKWILFIAERDNIDVRKGLIEWIKKEGPFKAFGFKSDAFYGKIKGVILHTNTRNDKFDLSPQPDLIDMLLSI